jgi:Rad52/22 family double-strand break repair protein
MARTSDDIRAALAAPFPPSDIEWRISHTNAEGTTAMVLAYITARAVMDRLDSVLGIGAWSSKLTRIDGGFICELSATIRGLPVTRCDVSQDSDVEPLKGGASGALKRAAVQFGIGRDLYDLPDSWVDLARAKTKGAHYHKMKDGSARYWLPPRLASATPAARPAPPVTPPAADRLEALADSYDQSPADDAVPLDVLAAEAAEDVGDANEDLSWTVPLKEPAAPKATSAATGDGTIGGLIIGHPCPDCSNVWPCSDHPHCPKCTAPMWDNREPTRGGKGQFPKKNSKAPDFTCRKKKQGCEGLYWTGEWQKAAAANQPPF